MPLNAPPLAPRDEAELAAQVAECHRLSRPLRVTGGGTRMPVLALPGQPLTTRHITGIVTYEPGALTLIVRAGTPVEVVKQALAAEGQALAFEPMDHRPLLGREGVPTIGGMVSANVSGPRRLRAGACRDHLLGVRFIDGRGRIIRNGGRVMKNVTGMDLGKLLCGAHGTLGILTEVALKTLPMAEAQETLAFPGLSPRAAVAVFSAALATPYEVSGAAFHDGTAWLRIEGLGPQLTYRRDRLAALFRDHRIEVMGAQDSRALWRDLRDLRHLAGRAGAVWRIFAKPTDAPAIIEALRPLGGAVSLDWGGGLIWYCGGPDAAAVREASGPGGALLVRAGPDGAGRVFPPEAPGLSRLSSALRHTFDPGAILNPGLMEG